MRSSIHARLRTATRDDHRRLDAHFPDGLPDARSYRMYLRGMHRFVADMAAVLEPAPETGSEALLALCSGAHAALAADLWDLQVTPLPPSSGLPDVGTGAGRLGWEYVLAGSAMGARSLRTQAARLGHGERHAARFLARHAVAADWPALLERIEHEIAARPEHAPAVHAGAAAAFAFADSCFADARDLEECLSP